MGGGSRNDATDQDSLTAIITSRCQALEYSLLWIYAHDKNCSEVSVFGLPKPKKLRSMRTYVILFIDDKKEWEGPVVRDNPNPIWDGPVRWYVLFSIIEVDLYSLILSVLSGHPPNSKLRLCTRAPSVATVRLDM